MENSLKNLVLTLFIITVVSSTSVGLIYGVTKKPIAAAQAQKLNQAIVAVVPQFDNNPTSDCQVKSIDGVDVNIYTAKAGDKVVGYAIESFSKQGFGGLIKVMVGFLPDGTINNVSVLSHSETPGLGDKIEAKKSSFAAQFSGKNPATFKLLVKKDGGDVDAITASTITSRAFADALSRAYTIYKDITANSDKSVDNPADASTDVQADVQADVQPATSADEKGGEK